MRYCGVDVSAKPGHQQLVTLHERRVRGGAVELVATFYAPGDVAAIARTVRGFGGEAVVGVDAPRAGGWTCSPPGSPLRERLGLPEGRYERSRVCDAILFRRGLPLYPVPPPSRRCARWEGWMEVGFDLFGALAPLGLFRPAVAGDPLAVEAPGGRRGAALRRGCSRPTPTPSSAPCSGTGRRRSGRPGACSSGSRPCACAASSTRTAGSGTAASTSSTPAPPPWRRTPWPTGSACWVGDPREGVIVLPGDGLLERYAKLPPPRRQALA